MVLGPDSIMLNGRVALVTGAAAGIGEAAALMLARFGATVALCDRDGEALARAASALEAGGAEVLHAAIDVRDRVRVEEFLAEVEERKGRIDVLVNNAGGSFYSAFLELGEGGREALIAENFTQVAAMIRAVVPLMPASGGSIINLSSIEAHRAAPGFAVYAAMKAAVENLTKSLALELGDRSIRVNSVAPDLIATPGMKGLGDAGRQSVLGRCGEPEDAAAVILFLACDLSRFVTGATIHVDGGAWAAAAWRRGDKGGFEL